MGFINFFVYGSMFYDFVVSVEILFLKVGNWNKKDVVIGR